MRCSGSSILLSGPVLLVAAGVAYVWGDADTLPLWLLPIPVLLVGLGIPPVLAPVGLALPVYLATLLSMNWLVETFSPYQIEATFTSALPLIRYFLILLALSLGLAYGTAFLRTLWAHRRQQPEPYSYPIRGTAAVDGLVVFAVVLWAVVHPLLVFGGPDATDRAYAQYAQWNNDDLLDQVLDSGASPDERLEALWILQARGLSGRMADDEALALFAHINDNAEKESLARAARSAASSLDLVYERPWYVTRTDLEREHFRSERHLRRMLTSELVSRPE